MKLRWLSPWTWLKVASSATALVVNAIQLSEVSDENGRPIENPAMGAFWRERATLVAFEARQIRNHLGVL